MVTGNSKVKAKLVTPRYLERARNWIRWNSALCIVILIAACQLPISILYLVRDSGSDVEPKAKPSQIAVKVEERKHDPPILPYRSDPFAPFPGDNTSANNTSTDQSQTSENEPATMAQALAGSSTGGILPPFNLNIGDKNLILRPLPSPSALLKNPPKPVIKPDSGPKHTKNSVTPTLKIIPKLQGVVKCRGCRVAVFEIGPGRITNVKPYERIPETDFAAKAIRDDGVFVVDTSTSERQFKYIPIGRNVAERL